MYTFDLFSVCYQHRCRGQKQNQEPEARSGSRGKRSCKMRMQKKLGGSRSLVSAHVSFTSLFPRPASHLSLEIAPVMQIQEISEEIHHLHFLLMIDISCKLSFAIK